MIAKRWLCVRPSFIPIVVRTIVEADLGSCRNGRARREVDEQSLTVDVRVRTAVNEMIAWHQSVINDKESVRAAGMTEKLLIVMTSPAVAARAGQAAPLARLRHLLGCVHPLSFFTA